MDAFPRAFGPYILLKPLARGGMGALYLAVSGDRGMEKLCVIKTVLPHLADKEYVQRFRDEAKVVVKLTHGNLVSVFDAGLAENELYLAMDFIEGKDLRATWNRCAHKGIAFPVDVAAYIVKELARGLGYAHAFGGLKLVHRDVSPPNILLAFTGEVKLTDFGLASSTLKMEKTAPGVIYGKVSYMAPEQARGEPLDGRTDLYAAGIILWELLTGRQLFPATPSDAADDTPPPDEVLSKVKNPTVDPPSRRAPRVPPDLDRIALKALAPAAGDRYQTGEDLRSDLAAYLAKTAPATDTDRVARFLRDLFGDTMDDERRERDVLVSTAIRADGKARTPAMPAGAGPDAVPAAGADASTSSTTPRAAEDDGAGVASLQHKREERRRGDAAAGASGAVAAVARTPGDSSTAVAALPAQAGDSSREVIGTVVGGRYAVRRLVGEGGMGKVYEAEHIEIGKRVALKILHPAYSRTPDVVERFKREARAATKIQHANVVDVTDSGTTNDGALFFVMEYVEGKELGLTVNAEGPFPIARALDIAAQMCRALQAAHDAGIIHRDLKPENVLLVQRETQADFVKVLDFGIAKSVEIEEAETTGRRLTHPGMAMGTPEYMAPEQAAGKSADPRSDVYAVGAILYQMLTGHPPYEGRNFMEILHKKANEMPRLPSTLRPDVPLAVERLLLRTMARDPAERPQSMADLEREILEIATAPIDHYSPALDETRPRGLRWAVGGGFAALVAALAVVYATRSGSAPPASEAPAPAAMAEPVAPAPAAAPAPPPQAIEPARAAEPEAHAAPAPEPDTAPTSRPAHAAAEAAKKALADGQKMLSAGRFGEARALFQKVLDGAGPRGRALLGLGQVAFQEGRYADAASFGKRGAAAGGGAPARVLLGDSLYKLERYAEAAKAYEAALKAEPGNSAAKTGLANARKRSN